MFKNLLAATALSIFGLTGVNAATVTFTTQPIVAVANPTTGIFTGTYLENITNPGLIAGSRSIWEGSALDGSVYSSITGSVTFNLVLSTAISFIWGSPDAYNSVEFYNGATLVDTAISPVINPLNIPNSFATIIASTAFDRVVFVSGSPAMEFGNFTSLAAVPLPAGGLLLIGAIGGLAALRRRKAV